MQGNNLTSFRKIKEFCQENKIDINKIMNLYAKNSFTYLAIYDSEFKIIWTNGTDEFYEKYGIDIDNFISKPCYELFYGKENPCKECALTKTIKTNKPMESELNTYYNDHFLVKAYPLKNEKGGIVAYFTEMLEKNKMTELKNSLEIEKKKIEMFTSLSHEFRTPISMMHTSLQVLEKSMNKIFEKEIVNKNKINKYLDIIKKNNNRLLKLVNNIMDLTKMDADKYNFNFEKLDIIKLVKEIVHSSEDHVYEQNKEIFFESNVNTKLIVIDGFEIERVLLNLISNAVKHTNEGDKIIVEVSEKEKHIIISVIDNGVGIPEDKQQKIFDKFTQVNNVLERDSNSSGLGLSIVKVIVESHNGDIEVESTPGEGSKFSVFLPKDLTESDETELCKNKCRLFDRLEVEYANI